MQGNEHYERSWRAGQRETRPGLSDFIGRVLLSRKKADALPLIVKP